MNTPSKIRLNPPYKSAMEENQGWDRWQRRPGLTILLVLLPFIQVAVTHDIRRNEEPFFYKSIFMQRPITFSTVPPSARENKMTMMVGMAKEDPEIQMKRIPPAAFVATSLPTPSLEEITENTIEDMVKVMMMEGEDPARNSVLSGLLGTMKEVNSTLEVNTRTGGSPSPSKSAKEFQDRVRDLLSISGVDAVLPFDCGRNPLSPTKPLGKAPFPWITALGSREDGRFHYRCTGIIVSNFHILTDADCAASANINIVQVNVTGLVPEPFAVENFVVGRRVHPSIRDKQDLLTGNNIGLLELALPFQFNDYVQPICLPGVFEDADPDERSTATIVGFDNIQDTPDGRSASLMAWSNSRTLGSARCYSAIRFFNEEFPEQETTLYNILTKKHICVDRNFELVGKSVVIREDPVTRRVKAIGIGAVANARKTNPIAYTLIQSHRFWVELIIKKFRDNTSTNRRS